MKIAIVSQEYPPETAKGGIGSQTYIKACGLARRGHQIFVISRSVNDNRHESMQDDVCVIRIPGMEAQFVDMTETVQWITHSVAVAVELDQLHKRVELDLVDFPEWAAEGYTYLLNRSEWNYVPVVIQLHGPLVMFGHRLQWPDMASNFYRTGIHMEATCVQLADAVFSSSRCSTDWIQRFYQPGKKTILTIHLGIDTAQFFPKPIAKHKRLTILFSGKIVPNKGIEELVEAAAILTKNFPDLCLRVLGKGDEKYIQQLKEKAESLDAPLLLQFPGFIQKEHLPEELSRAHVFAAPSWYEGGPGFVYLEAMACGLPVVGCSGSGVEEIITSDETGMLVPPKDSKALQNALQKILSDKSFSEMLGANARAYVQWEADSEHCLDKLEAFYLSVVKQKHLVHD